MTINYTTYISQISNLLTIPSSDPNFQTMVPGMIDYAEQRMYRELDLLATRVVDSTGSLSSGNRNFNLPTTTGTFLVVENANVITPSTATSTSGTRNPLTFVTPDYIDFVYPANSAGTSTPEYVAMLSNTTLIVGPPPDAPYVMEIYGTQRPSALSSNNSSTILTQMLPDIFIAASMVFASGYTRDFSAQGDNPQQGASWESQYQKLFQSANVEEFRKKYQSAAWSDQIPSPTATPSRV